MREKNKSNVSTAVKRFSTIKKSVLFGTKKHYIILISTVLFSVVLYRFAYLFQQDFNKIMAVATYLTWHNLFEFSSILVSFAVFVVSYFTFEQTQNLNSLFLGSIFLTVGMIDAFHTLSFMGMPDFFIANQSANRATTFWIISRLVSGIGFLISSFISSEKKTAVKKQSFLIISIIFSVTVLITVTYFPELFPSMYIMGKGLTSTKIFLEYVVITTFGITIIRTISEYKKTKNHLMILFSCALILNIFSELAFTDYYLVYDIYNYLGHIYKAIAYYIIFRVIFIHNVQKPYVELAEAQNELRNYAENLDRIVEQRTRQLKQVNERLLDDLEYARDIQMALLPSRLPLEEEVSFTAGYFPAERVSGDCYNIFKIDSQHIGMYIADVSGHGVPAAMLTVFLSQNIKMGTFDYRNEITNPSKVLNNVYEAFNSTNFSNGVYIVLIYAVYNIRTRELTYSSAGMNAIPLIINKRGGVREIEVKGFPICKFREFYTYEYKNTVLELDPGDSIIFYTDGLVEAQNQAGEFFSENRLKEFLKNNGETPALELSNGIANEVFNFMGNGKLKDDITFFIMEVK
jgi:sigma-B regulation protein RsbU (phosphoserine phosphatase)